MRTCKNCTYSLSRDDAPLYRENYPDYKLYCSRLDLFTNDNKKDRWRANKCNWFNNKMVAETDRIENKGW